jgi:hypothetical protein
MNYKEVDKIIINHLVERINTSKADVKYCEEELQKYASIYMLDINLYDDNEVCVSNWGKLGSE